VKQFLALPTLALLAGLTACAPYSDEAEPSGQAPPPELGGTCMAKGLDKHIGAKLTLELGEQIRKEAKAAVLRTASQNGAITMDFNPNRVNIFHDEKRAIVRINCG
jgi:Peptidase inhibitor I78 family